MQRAIESMEGSDMPTAPAKTREEESAASPAIGPDATMADILHAYPTAKIALFIRYHIGGCTSCSYQLTDTLAEVCQNYSIADSFEAVRAIIRQSASVEAKIHISQQELASALQRGEDLRLLDTRSTSEWQAGHLVGARPVTVELTFNALDSWSKETPIVFYSNEGRRSLDKAAYFQAYGFTNARSLDGGIQDWPGRLESPLTATLP
jgi:rhodanese-related sulfurtransferase